MRRRWSPGRRRFLGAAAAAVAIPAASCNRENSPWRTLTTAEAATAAAVCECLIPGDEFPGAGWAGAVNYIDTQLYGHYRKHRGLYRAGLAALDAASRERYGKPFAEAPAPSQVELLERVEKGAAPADSWKPAEQKRFFATILAHTMQSYYGDPRHGGNRDGAGYRSIGLTSTPVRGRSQHDLTAITNPGGV